MQTLCYSHRVVTQDKIDFELFMTKLRETATKEKMSDSLEISAFYTLSDADFEQVSKMFDTDIPYAKSSDCGNLGSQTRDVLLKAELNDEFEMVEHLLSKFYDAEGYEQLVE